MKKLGIVLSAVIVALFVASGDIPAAYAADTPMYESGREGGSDYMRFYANGTPIMITAGASGGTTISWESGALGFTAAEAAILEVYGGYKNSITVVDTSIIMVGGSVNMLCGGGRGGSAENPVHVRTANIVIVGGTITRGVSIGGFNTDNTGGLSSSLDNSTAYNIVDGGSLTIKSSATGNGSAAIFSGGFSGFCHVSSATVDVSAGDWYAAIAGGSDGFVDNATMTISGDPTFNNIHGNNRGSVGDFDLTITGGTIGNVFAGADIPALAGGTLGSANIVVAGGAITNLQAGHTVEGSIANNPSIQNKIAFTIDTECISGAIEGFAAQNKQYFVVIDGTRYAAANNKALSENSWYNGIVSKPGFSFVGFTDLTTNTSFDPSAPILKSQTLATVFSADTGSGSSVIPATADSMPFGAGAGILTLSLIVFVGAYAARNRSLNKASLIDDKKLG